MTPKHALHQGRTVQGSVCRLPAEYSSFDIILVCMYTKYGRKKDFESAEAAELVKFRKEFLAAVLLEIVLL